MHSYIFTQTTLGGAWDKIKDISGFKQDLEDYHHPDIFILRPEVNEKTVKKSASIKIESIRNLQTQLSQLPLRLPYQIGIIEEAHLLTLPAQQSLLKLLEEPKHQTFLFLVTSASHHAFLPTVISRCQVVTGTIPANNYLPTDDIAQQLKELTTLSMSGRMKFFESLGSADKATTWLKTVLVYLQKTLPYKPLVTVVRLIDNIQTALNDIGTNVNTKLVLDQLAIHWTQEKLDGNH